MKSMNTLNWSPKALKQLRKIDATQQKVIYRAAQALTQWPDCHADIKALANRIDYRLRVGNYRVIFEIDQSGTPVVVLITEVRKRDERTY